MSTEIKDTWDSKHFTVIEMQGADVRVEVASHQFAVGVISRADFLDAIRTELNVIIIDKADLPEVEPDGDAEGHGGARIPRLRAGARVGYADDLASNHRLAALGHLALAEYLDAHPPLSELGSALVERAGMDRDEAERVARLLTEDGWSR